MENKRDMEAVVKSRKEKEQRAVPQPVNKGQLSYKRWKPAISVIFSPAIAMSIYRLKCSKVIPFTVCQCGNYFFGYRVVIISSLLSSISSLVCSYLLVELPLSLPTSIIVNLYSNCLVPNFGLVDTAIGTSSEICPILNRIINLWRIELAEHKWKLQAGINKNQKDVSVFLWILHISKWSSNKRE